jgi:hypothetical protein
VLVLAKQEVARVQLPYRRRPSRMMSSASARSSCVSARRPLALGRRRPRACGCRTLFEPTPDCG